MIGKIQRKKKAGFAGELGIQSPALFNFLSLEGLGTSPALRAFFIAEGISGRLRQ